MKYILLNTESTPAIMPDPYDDSLLILDDLDMARAHIEDYEALGFTYLMIVPLDRRLMDLIEQAAEFVDISLFQLDEFEKDDLEKDDIEEINTLSDELYELLG
jgi:hypothetical protein